MFWHLHVFRYEQYYEFLLCDFCDGSFVFTTKVQTMQNIYISIHSLQAMETYTERIQKKKKKNEEREDRRRKKETDPPLFRLK